MSNVTFDIHIIIVGSTKLPATESLCALQTQVRFFVQAVKYQLLLHVLRKAP